MNGDLGNLLTGEMGEAESRFAYDDFAEAYGRRVAGRVRRRRAVRAAGVGGGTMLTAGALVVGATHMPWGALGAASGMGVGPSVDCVTPSPSTGEFAYSVRVETNQGPLGEVVYTDNATGKVIFRGGPQSDGTFVFTDGDGNSIPSTLDSSGAYLVGLPSGSATSGSTTWFAVFPDDAASGETRLILPSGSDSAAPAPSASDDCYTPNPTPSPTPSRGSLVTGVVDIPSTDPSLAAKPEDVVVGNPFQCGFTFPTESSKANGLWIDGTKWMDGAAAAAAIREGFSDPSQAPSIGSLPEAVPVVTVHFAGAITDSGLAVAFGTAEPSLDRLPTDPMDSATDWVASEGTTYVGVVDGRVVATGTVPVDESRNAPPVYLDLRPYDDGSLLYLLNQGAALTSCDANPVDFAQIDLVAVAGLIVKHPDGTVDGPTYAWTPVGKP